MHYRKKGENTHFKLYISLLTLLYGKKIIPGIHNYCDRWCERCSFTNRCKNYDSTSKLSPAQLDVHNKAFWDTISLNFEKAIELLNKAADKYGISLDTLMTKHEETKYNKRKTGLDIITKEHTLSKLYKQYQTITRPFIKKSEGFVDKTRELVTHLHLGIKSPEDVVYTVADIGDCFEIIQWHLFLIDAKLQRAIRGKTEGQSWETDNSLQKDSDGSAKIALIAIEKSIVTWVKLHELIPASEDTALHALSLLVQLKEKTTTEFPMAMKFKRPGFDE